MRAVRGIKCAFRKITSYTFPFPGSDIAGASVDEKKWKLAGELKSIVCPILHWKVKV